MKEVGSESVRMGNHVLLFTLPCSDEEVDKWEGDRHGWEVEESRELLCSSCNECPSVGYLCSKKLVRVKKKKLDCISTID